MIAILTIYLLTTGPVNPGLSWLDDLQPAAVAVIVVDKRKILLEDDHAD